jgi:hypothetical protein
VARPFLVSFLANVHTFGGAGFFQIDFHLEFILSGSFVAPLSMQPCYSSMATQYALLTVKMHLLSRLHAIKSTYYALMHGISECT